MNERPFDPMDKILREALASDAQVPGDLTGRIMSRVADTPQQRAASRGNPYRKWFFSAAACLVLAAVALPLALNSHKNAADTATPDMCVTSAAPRDSGDMERRARKPGTGTIPFSRTRPPAARPLKRTPTASPPSPTAAKPT